MGVDKLCHGAIIVGMTSTDFFNLSISGAVIAIPLMLLAFYLICRDVANNTDDDEGLTGTDVWFVLLTMVLAFVPYLNLLLVLIGGGYCLSVLVMKVINIKWSSIKWSSRVADYLNRLFKFGRYR